MVDNTFWICAVVGEFILLLLIFEVILYYKDHGLIYKISRRCKTQKSSKNDSKHGKI